MNRIINVACAAAGLIGAAFPALSGAAEYIANGNFEQSTLAGPTEIANPLGYTLASPAIYGTSITGWVIPDTFGENIYYYQNATATQGFWPLSVEPLASSFQNVATVPGDTLQPGAVQNDPDTGGHFVALDGNNFSQGDTSISQTVTGLTAGQDYHLTFDWGGVQLANWTGPTTESFKVWLGDAPLSGQSQSTATVAEGTHFFSGWMEAAMDFVATSSTQVLTFQAIGTPSGSPPMLVLDDVSLTDVVSASPPPTPVSAVPEASTWAMMMMGCVTIGSFGLFRIARSSAR